jgi:hypothetical protein
MDGTLGNAEQLLGTAPTPYPSARAQTRRAYATVDHRHSLGMIRNTCHPAGHNSGYLYVKSGIPGKVLRKYSWVGVMKSIS